jgi:hypothetical protein
MSMLADVPLAQAKARLTKGDEAILRFVAAAETLEADFWLQYNELGGIQDSELPGGSSYAAYTNALTMLDTDMPQYIHDNTDDEFTHFRFLTPISRLAVADRSTWRSSEPCRAVRPQEHRRSSGSPT